MSDLVIAELKKQLQATKDQNEATLKTVQAQLEAHKQMINEALATNLSLRTQLVMFQQALTDANQKVTNLQVELENATAPTPPAPVQEADAA